MNNCLLYLPDTGQAMAYAATALKERGILLADAPGPEVTHLLLPAPAFREDGTLKDGTELAHLLAQLPEKLTVMGGKLNHPALLDRKTVDLLEDPEYLAKNAAITADCALRVAGSQLPVVFQGCPVLIIGWGRIGKCLAELLQDLGADVTVAARKESDRAMLRALGFRAEAAPGQSVSLQRHRLLFNTAPAPVLSADAGSQCRRDCVKIDLASRLGLEGDGVIWARGLPGKLAPESSGLLIAETVIRLISQKEDCL